MRKHTPRLNELKEKWESSKKTGNSIESKINIKTKFSSDDRFIIFLLLKKKTAQRALYEYSKYMKNNTQVKTILLPLVQVKDFFLFKFTIINLTNLNSFSLSYHLL